MCSSTCLTPHLLTRKHLTDVNFAALIADPAAGILSAYRLPLLRRHPCELTLREEVRFTYLDWTILG